MAPPSPSGSATGRPTLVLRRATMPRLSSPRRESLRSGSAPPANPVFNVPASMLGIPALSLPLLSIDGLPLGLQIAGFVGEDASLFAVAAAIRDLLGTAA